MEGKEYVGRNRIGPMEWKEYQKLELCAILYREVKDSGSNTTLFLKVIIKYLDLAVYTVR